MDNEELKKSASKKILIVEDEDVLSNVLKLKLTSAGFDVLISRNGQEALDLINSNNFDLVITDLIMPVMDGFSLLQKLKEKDFKSPIIVLSNLSQAEDLDKAKALGAKDFLIKSNVPLSEIAQHINKLL